MPKVNCNAAAVFNLGVHVEGCPALFSHVHAVGHYAERLQR